MFSRFTERQLNEISFHKEFGKRHADLRFQVVRLDIIENDKRRWWNAYWSTYTRLLSYDLRGKRVLVPGCGFGEDAIRIASLGASVSAFDISPDIVDIARDRATRLNQKIDIQVMPSEQMAYDDGYFDFAIFFDILHHVDIPKTCKEVRRVVKPGGRVIGNELYTNSLLEKHIRRSAFVDKYLYPMMHNFIYRKSYSYVTEDEHKIDEIEFQYITDICSEIDVEYFNTFAGRLFPEKMRSLCKLDRVVTKAFGSMGRYSAGRVVFDGRLPSLI